MSVEKYRIAGQIKVQPLLNVEDVARRLGVSKRTVYAMVAQRRIPFLKPPGTNLLRFGILSAPFSDGCN